MYKTILLTLDGTPTDRAMIEHVKSLAKLAQSRVVLLHVADGWAARTYGPDAVSREITDDTAYLKKIRSEFQSHGNPHGCGTGLRRAGQRDHQMGQGEGLRSGGDEHTRTSLSGRHISW